MNEVEALNILKNAAFLATNTTFQAIEEAISVVVKALEHKNDLDINKSERIENKDYIYREDAYKAVDLRIEELRKHPQFIEKHLDTHVIDVLGVKKYIDKIPPIKPKKENGRWYLMDDGYCDYYVCSKCGATNGYKSNFCPNCGADMRGEQDG